MKLILNLRQKSYNSLFRIATSHFLKKPENCSRCSYHTGFRSLRTMNCTKAAAIFSVVSFGFWNVLSETFMSLPRLCPIIYMQKEFLCTCLLDLTIFQKLKRQSLMSNYQNVCSNIWNQAILQSNRLSKHKMQISLICGWSQQNFICCMGPVVKILQILPVCYECTFVSLINKSKISFKNA